MKKLNLLACSLLLVICSSIIVFLTNCEDKLSIPTLETTEVTDITSNSATTGGTIKKDGGYQIYEMGVCWSTTPLPTIDNPRTFDSTDGLTFVSQLTNLDPETTYYVRAYASNDMGTAYGDELVFTTLEGSAATGDLEVFVREGNPNGTYIGEAEVKIYLSAEDRSNDKPYQVGMTPKDNPSVNGALFTGLTYRKYYLRAKYTNGQGLWMGVHELYITTGQTTKTQVVAVL